VVNPLLAFWRRLVGDDGRPAHAPRLVGDDGRPARAPLRRMPHASATQASETIFLILRQIGLANTHAGLVLIYVVWALPFALWMLQGFVRNIPRDLEEAASVDGATRLQVLRRVVLPLLAPGVVATAVFAFISAWNEFFFALVLIKTPQLATLPVALARFVGIEGTARLGPLAAGSLLATLPSLVFFAVMQRRLSSGSLAGAVKG